MSSPENPTPAVEEESVSSDQDITADLGQNSVGHVPEESEEVDSPDTDLASEVPQEEEPEETAAAEPEEEEPGEPEPEEEVEEHPEISKEALQKEIEELQEKARQAREKWEHWRDASRDARAAHFQGREVEEPPPGPEPGTPEVPAAKPPPKEDDFDDYNEYIDALTDYKVDQKMAEYDRQTQLRAANETHAAKRATLVEKLAQGSEKYDDFDEVINDPIVPIHEGMVDILAETEYPAEIAYYLGKNLATATKISRMPPLAAARAIGSIEAKIAADEEKTSSGPSAAPKPPVKKATTSAPEPITPVKPRGAEVVSKDPSKMTNEEYRAWRMGHMQRK